MMQKNISYRFKSIGKILSLGGVLVFLFPGVWISGSPSPSCWASNIYYIDPILGDDATAEPNNIDKPYKRLKNQFRYILLPGDTLCLRGGLYENEFFQPGVDGTALQPIQVINYPGEIPILSGPGYYSVVLNLHGRRYFIVDGIHFENTRGDAVILIGMGAEHNIVRNCRFKTHIWGNMLNIEMAQFNRVENCTFDTVGSPEAEGVGSHIMIKGGHQNLIQNNFLIRAGHSSILVEYYTSEYEPPYQNIIRNNIIEQHWGTGVSLGLQAHDTLIESNQIYYCGEEVQEHEKSSIHIRSDNNIVRYNVTAFTGANTPKKHYGIEMEAYRFGIQQNCRNNRFYNNVVYKSGNAGIFLTQRKDCILSGNKVVNNIVYYNKVGGYDSYWSTSSVVFDTYHAYDTNKWLAFANSNQFYNNLFLYADQEGDHPDYSPFVYYNGDEGWTKSVHQTENSFPNAFAENIDSNPKFVNADGKDFHLEANSPAIDTGVYLTYTLEGGNRCTEVKVEDSLFFCDGYGIIPGDLIQIGSNQPVRIIQVDTETNVLTVSDPVTFSAGDPVSLAYAGTAPDLGAYEYGTLPQYHLSATGLEGWGAYR